MDLEAQKFKQIVGVINDYSVPNGEGGRVMRGEDYEQVVRKIITIIGFEMVSED